MTESTPWWWRLLLALAVAALGWASYSARESLGPRGQAVFGFMGVLGLVALASANLRAVRWRTISSGILLQWTLALFILKFEVNGRRLGYECFEILAGGVTQFLTFPMDGMRLVFGMLADQATTNRMAEPASGYIFAFQTLPIIIFLSAFFSVLFHLGILQWVTRLVARIMIGLMQTSGAETLSGVANVFMGQSEAPLIVKPYIAKMTQSELLSLMVGGMATISGSLMAVYIQLGADPVAILATSVMAAPCGLYVSKLLLPETGVPLTRGAAPADPEITHRSVIDAAAGGAIDGLYLCLFVGAMLIAFLGLLAAADFALGRFPSHPQGLVGWLGESEDWPLVGNLLLLGLGYAGVRALALRLGPTPAPAVRLWLEGFAPIMYLALVHLAILYAPEGLSLRWIFSRLFAPMAVVMGVPEADWARVADLLGTKLVANEFIAYLDLGQRYAGEMQPRSHILATYALTGFANFGSIAIQVGSVGAMAPERRGDIAELGLRALLGGFLATILNATIAGILLE